LVSRNEKAASLAEQAAFVFAALGIEQHEERFSSNYPPDEHYFLGHAANLSVTVCDSDGTEMPEYPYWVVLEEPVPWGKGTAQVHRVPSKVAEELARAGLNVFVPSAGWGRVGWEQSGQFFARVE
jgi:hypothetical protein